MRKYLILISAIILSLIISIPVFAATESGVGNLFLGDEEVNRTLNNEEDVYSFGSKIILSGNTKGDILSVAGTIELNDVQLGGSIRTISGDLNISAKEVRNITSMAQNIVIQSNTVAKGVYVLGSTIEFNGTADEFYGAGGNITINGTINGDVKVECGTLTIGKDAKILGKLDVKATKEPIILGEYNQNNMSFVQTDATSSTNARTFLVDKLLSLASALVIGLVIILLCKNFLVKGHRRLISRGWIPFVIGFTTLIVLPFAALFTMITVIGIPVSIISLMVYGVLIYLSPVIAGILVGPFILRNKDILLSSFVGVVLVKVLTFIPFVGLVTTFAAIFLTLGVFIINISENISNFKLKA